MPHYDIGNYVSNNNLDPFSFYLGPNYSLDMSETGSIIPSGREFPLVLEPLNDPTYGGDVRFP